MFFRFHKGLLPNPITMKRHRKESRSRKRRRFMTGFFCMLMAFAVSDVFAESDAESLPMVRFLQDDSMILGQRSLSNLFFFDPTWRPRHSSFDFQHPSGAMRLRTWLRGFGNWTNSSDRDGTAETKGGGVSLGIDRQFGRNILVGLGLGGSWCSAEEKQQGVTTDVSAFHGSLYSRIRLRRFYFDLEGGLGSNDNKRSGVTKTAFQSHLNGEVGTWWELGLAKVEPYFGVRQVWYDDHSARIGDKTASVLGLRYSWKTASRLATTTPRIYGGWLHEWGDRDLFNVGTFVDSPTVYRFVDGRNGPSLKSDRLFVGGGFTTAMGASLDVYLRYTAEIASNYSAHTLLLGMNWNY